MPMLLSRTNITLATALDSIRQQSSHVFDAVRTARMRRAQYSKTYSELARLSDRELSDLGFARANIRKIAKQELLKGADQ